MLLYEKIVNGQEKLSLVGVGSAIFVALKIISISVHSVGFARITVILGPAVAVKLPLVFIISRLYLL